MEYRQLPHGNEREKSVFRVLAWAALDRLPLMRTKPKTVPSLI